MILVIKSCLIINTVNAYDYYQTMATAACWPLDLGEVVAVDEGIFSGW